MQSDFGWFNMNQKFISLRVKSMLQTLLGYTVSCPSILFLLKGRAVSSVGVDASDCGYQFTTDLEPNEILFGSKSIGNW